MRGHAIDNITIAAIKTYSSYCNPDCPYLLKVKLTAATATATGVAKGSPIATATETAVTAALADKSGCPYSSADV